MTGKTNQKPDDEVLRQITELEAMDSSNLQLDQSRLQLLAPTNEKALLLVLETLKTVTEIQNEVLWYRGPRVTTNGKVLRHVLQPVGKMEGFGIHNEPFEQDNALPPADMYQHLDNPHLLIFERLVKYYKKAVVWHTNAFEPLKK